MTSLDRLSGHYIFTFHFSIKDLQLETSLWTHQDHIDNQDHLPDDHDMYSAHVNDDSDDQCYQKEQNVLLADHQCHNY